MGAIPNRNRHVQNDMMAAAKLRSLTAIATFTAAMILLPPWQGAFDRLGALSSLPVPSGSSTPAATTLTLLHGGAWWRVEPDYSYFLVFHEAFARRSPVLLVTPMGPWGFLFRGWHPATQIPLLISWVLLAAGFWWGASISLRPWNPIWLAALLFTTFALPRDTILLVLPVMLLYVNEERGPATVPLTVLAALSALVKSSSLVICVIVIAACAVRDVMVRRFPRMLVTFPISFFALYLAAGRALADLPVWFRATMHMLTAFGDAWSLDTHLPALTVTLLIIAVIIVAANEARHDRIRAVALALAGAAFLKAGLGRADAFHLAISESAILTLFVFCAPRLPSRLFPIATIAGVLATVPAISPAEVARQVTAAAHPIRAARASKRLFENEMSSIRRATPLPHLAGTVDWFDARQSVVVANGLTYSPRPIFQSYIAADATLAAMNAPHSTDWVLYEPLPIDDHYPASEDSRAWRERLTRYELAGVTQNIAVLRRREHPRELPSEQLPPRSSRIGEAVAVPDGALMWTSIGVQPTLLGRLRGTFQGLAPLYIEVTLADGSVHRFRIVPATARDGFLLSPLVINARGFAAISLGRIDLMRRFAVRTFRITTNHPGSYEPEMTVHFERITS